MSRAFAPKCCNYKTVRKETSYGRPLYRQIIVRRKPFTEVPRKTYHFSSAEESGRFHRVTNNRERGKGGGRPEKVDRKTKSEIDANKLRQCVKSFEKRTGKSIKTWSLKNEWKILCL